MTRRQLIVALALWLGAAGCSRSSDSKPADPPKTAVAPAATDAHVDPNEVRVDEAMLRDLRITTAVVESRVGAEDVALLGELAVDERRYAEVGAPIPARALRLLAGPGDCVQQGQLLVELQSSELGKLRADYVSASARVTLTEMALKRKRDLAAERIAPEREVQEAEAEAAAARASLRAATASLAALGITPSSEDTDAREAASFGLRSPVSGTVLERNIVQGQMLEPSTPAFRVANLSTLWLAVHAYERDAVRVQKGASARLSFSALPGQDFRGVVALIGGQVEKESRTVPIRIDVGNPKGVLRPGMSGTAAVAVGPSNARVLSVPVAAVQRVRNEWCVFIPKDASSFEIRKIGRGRDLGGEVEVLSGLRAGEKIVVEGAFLLKSQAEKGEAEHESH